MDILGKYQCLLHVSYGVYVLSRKDTVKDIVYGCDCDGYHRKIVIDKDDIIKMNLVYQASTRLTRITWLPANLVPCARVNWLINLLSG